MYENASVANDKSTLDLTSRAMHATCHITVAVAFSTTQRSSPEMPDAFLSGAECGHDFSGVAIGDNQPIISVSFVTLRSDTAFPESGETHHKEMHFVRANCAFFHDDLVDIPK